MDLPPDEVYAAFADTLDRIAHSTPQGAADVARLRHARCCSFRFELSAQDLEEGTVRWDLQQPYLIRQEKDHFCTHVDRAKGGGCTIYERRPAPCRAYDCRQDRRVWIDFEKRIPAPMEEGGQPIAPPSR